MNFSYYSPPDMEIWKGRLDSEKKERVFQHVQPINYMRSKQIPPQSICLCGFRVDEGVRRNLGRPGAKEGPNAIRRHLANLCLTLPEHFHLLDMGNIDCPDGNLEKAQEQLGSLVYKILAAGSFPLVLGGGHETAFGTYLGIHQFLEQSVLIYNFDAHFDLRPLQDGKGTSGTPFKQMANLCEESKRDFFYTCFGIQPSSNTKSLFFNAHQHLMEYFLAEEIMPKSQEILQKIHNKRNNYRYVSFCLDVLQASQAPGVSAPQTLGLFTWQIFPILEACLANPHLLAFDLAELAPCYDQQEITAKLAAEIVRKVIYIKSRYKALNNY